MEHSILKWWVIGILGFMFSVAIMVATAEISDAIAGKC